MVITNFGGLIDLITLKKKGFFTASFLILLICLSVSTAALSLVQDQNLTQNCISLYDRQFLTGKEQLNAIELKITSDIRFPNFAAYLAYMTKYPKDVFRANEVDLKYLGSVKAPNGRICHRFSITSTVNGISFVRPVLAEEGPSGQLEFHLVGIAF